MTNTKTVEINKVYEGKVTNIVKFGAFVQLVDTNVNGLLHISKIADQFVSNIEDFINIDDVIQVKVIEVNGNRISLELVR